MNWADWTIVAIVGVSCLVSLLRGFVQEALSLLVWIAATFVAVAFHQRLADVLAHWIETPTIRSVLAFGALFIATLIIGGLLTYLLRTAVAATGLGGLDRLLGMAFGAARGLLIVLAIAILLPMALPVKEDAWWRQSRLIPYFEPLDGWARDTFDYLMGWGKSLSHEAQTPPAGAHGERR